MADIDYTRAAKYFLLADFFKGFKLGMKYFFAPKPTVIPTVKSVASHVNCAKRSAPRRRLLSTPSPVMTAAAAPRAMTSI
jgi:hypothetical protein